MSQSIANNETGPNRSERKRAAILEAAGEMFLAQGFLGTSMDQVAARAAVSKQTLYKQFESKEALFVAIVQGMTGTASARVQTGMPEPDTAEELAGALTAYAERQLSIVLTPRLMQLRRLVIGEATRFPELGAALYHGGPGRAIAGLAEAFARWADRGLLVAGDPRVAAAHFNWLVMGEAVNRAMMFGDAALPSPAERRGYVADGVRAFVAAYAARSEAGTASPLDSSQSAL